jgi:hypothetical protein
MVKPEGWPNDSRRHYEAKKFGRASPSTVAKKPKYPKQKKFSWEKKSNKKFYVNVIDTRTNQNAIIPNRMRGTKSATSIFLIYRHLRSTARTLEENGENLSNYQFEIYDYIKNDDGTVSPSGNIQQYDKLIFITNYAPMKNEHGEKLVERYIKNDEGKLVPNPELYGK